MAANAEPDGYDINVTDIIEFGDYPSVKYFTIESSDAYTVYQLNSDIYYRDSEEFFQIIENVKDEIAEQTVEQLKYDYVNIKKPLESYPIENYNDCQFIISSIFASLTGNTYDNYVLDENIIIKKDNKIQTDYVVKDSVMYDEAKHGTKEDADFKQEIEDKQKKDGTVGALDQPQQESLVFDEDAKAILEAAADEIFYEPNDRVLVNGEKAYITNVVEDSEGKQHLTVMKAGQILQLEPSLVKPDPDQFRDLTDLEPRDQMDLELKQSKTDKMADLNGKTVECNIVVDGMQFNKEPFKASLRDIAEGLNVINVTNDRDTQDKWPIENLQFEEENWPYAVIANEEDEPLRKIKINPTSFINAKEDDDLVDCLVGDKLTQLPKRVIRIVS